MKKPAPKKNFLDHLTTPAPSDAAPLTQALPAPPPTPLSDYVSFTNRLTNENDLRLRRHVYHAKGATIVRVLNDALREYLAKYPESDQPLPIELPR